MVSQQMKSVFLVYLFFAMMVNYGSNAEARRNNLRKRDLKMTSGGIVSDASPNYQESNANPTRAEITNVSSEEPVVAEPYRTSISVKNEPNELTHDNDINPLRHIDSDTSPNDQDSNANPTRVEINDVSSEEPVVAEPYRTTISEPSESTHDNDINPLRHIDSDTSPNHQDSNANPTRVEINDVSSEEPVVAEPYRTTISVQQQQGNEPNESTNDNDINPLRQTIIDNLVVGNGREVPAPDQANPNSVVGRDRYTWNEVIGYDASPADPYQAQQQEQESDTQTNTNPLHVVNAEQEQDGTNHLELPSEENISPLRPEPAEDISTTEAQETSTERLRGKPINP